IKVQLFERCGLPPDPARTLLDIARLRQQAQKLGIRKLEGNEKGGVIEFAEKNHVNPAWLIGLPISRVIICAISSLRARRALPISRSFSAR
ncbi:hypothetical protein DNQ45_12190, partial [Escherichia coli]